MVEVIVPCRIIGSRQGRVPAQEFVTRRTVPTYQYACTECGHAFEQFQSFSDDALTVCPECDGRLRKVFNAVGVVFKGSGFYRTDSRSSGSSSSTTSSSSDSSSTTTKTESKPAATASASSSSTSSSSAD
jgi:putative FmdB family regulatory protein